ncbi:hypothetical protein ACWEKT_40375 [Nocardia takedensis]|uniref:hypothetical protein n=1 Tax=Nocardia takedensis TaxID=259390 RepID=UPI003F775C3A
MSPSSIHLRFRIGEVRAVAEHALAAADFFPSLTERIAGRRGIACLVWAHDNGAMFLMSNGVPGFPVDPMDRFGPTRVVYPCLSNRDADRAFPFGRATDVAEHISLCTPDSSGRRLIDEIRVEDERDPDGWFVLLVGPERLEVGFASSLSRAVAVPRTCDAWTQPRRAPRTTLSPER